MFPTVASKIACRVAPRSGRDERGDRVRRVVETVRRGVRQRHADRDDRHAGHSVLPSGARHSARSAADLAHRAARAGRSRPGRSGDRPTSSPTARVDRVGEVVVGAAVAQHRAEVDLVEREQARAELALGGDAHAVAVLAERLGHARRSRRRRRGRRRSGTARRARRAPARAHALARRAGTRRRSGRGSRAPGTTWSIVHSPGRVERHELDEAHADAAVAPERGEVDDLVVVDAADHDRVDLHGVEAGVERGVDPGEHPVELVAAGQREEACRGAACRARC